MGSAEWVGGSVRLPDEEAFVWLDDEGTVRGIATGAIESFRAASANATPTPGRVRVAEDAIADTLRRALAPDVEVVCAPTPELASVAASLRAEHADSRPPSYLGAGLPPSAAAELFAAAADLARAAPWNKVEEHASVFTLVMPDANIEEGIVTVMGRQGERRGILVFPNVDDFRCYLEGALEALERDRPPSRVGRHFLLDFAKGRDIPPAMRKEISAHHWEVAAPDSYPGFLEVDEQLVALPLDPTAASLVTRIARALVAFVTTGALTTEGVTLAPSSSDVAFDEDATLAAMDGDLDTLALYEEFLASPEAPKEEDEHGWPLVVLNLIEDRFDATLTTLTPWMLGEVVFELLPQLPESEAALPHIRAFFTFLARTTKCECAEDCARLLLDA